MRYFDKQDLWRSGLLSVLRIESEATEQSGSQNRDQTWGLDIEAGKFEA